MVKRRWPSLVELVPCLPRSSLLGTKLERIVAGLRRSQSFGLARPHTRVCHLPSSSPHADLQHATYTLQPIIWGAPANLLLCSGPMLYCLRCVTYQPTATCQGRREPPRGRQAQSLEIAHSTVMSPCRGRAARSVSSAAPQQPLHDRLGSSQGAVCSGARRRAR